MDGSKLVLELEYDSIVELGRYVERRVVQQQIMVSFADTRVKERIFIYFLIFGFFNHARNLWKYLLNFLFMSSFIAVKELLS